MVLTAYVALSPVTGLFCHRRLADMFLSLPGRADLNSARLDASVGASGPHDFAVRESVSRQRAGYRSQVFRPTLRSHRAQNAAASTASRPYVRDDHDTPLCVGRDAKSSRCDLGGTETEIFLQRGLDCPNQIDPIQQIRLCAQIRTRQREQIPLVSRTRCSVLHAAPQSRDPWQTSGTIDPGLAAHRCHSASKTRVNALMALRSIRGTTRTGKTEQSPGDGEKILSGDAAAGLKPFGDFGQHADRGLAGHCRLP